MTSKKIFGYLVVALALVSILITTVSASYFAEITDIEVSGVDVLDSSTLETVDTPVSVSAQRAFPVLVTFTAWENAEDVRVKAWIAGEKEQASISDRFVVFEGNTYSKFLSIQIPNGMDEDKLKEELNLNIVVESRNQGTGDEKSVLLTLQRDSYAIDILDVNSPSEVIAGELLPLDVVVKNTGIQFADDTFVVARIEALGIENKAYFGDLSPIDQPITRDPFFGNFEDIKENPEGSLTELAGVFDRLDKEDSAERRLSLRIPSDVEEGIYTLEIEAFNDDSSSIVTKKIVVKGAESTTTVVSPVHSKSFSAGSKSEYSLTLVNTGSNVKVYEMIVESPQNLNVEISDPVVAVPAGSSSTVKLKVDATKSGDYDFAVNVHSGTKLIKSESFSAKVNGTTATEITKNSTVLLTVVLAIIFVVLLVVLIVLLTRKPDKQEETGESYY